MKACSWIAVAALAVLLRPDARANSPATVSHSAPSTVEVGQSFTVDASCADPDGNLSGMCVRWQGMGLQAYWPESGYSASESVTLTAPSVPGSINIRAEAVDTLGEGSDSGWQTIEVVAPNHPATVSLSAPATVYVGQAFSVGASCADEDGNLSGMAVRWQGVGLVAYWPESGNSASESVTLTAPSTPGTFNIRSEAIDLLGEGSDSGWTTVQVIDYPVNSPPTISLSFLSTSTPPVPTSTAPAGANFTVRADAADADGGNPAWNLDSMGIRWQDHDLAGWWAISGGSASQSVTLSVATPGTQHFRGEVWDHAPAGAAGDWQDFVIVGAGSPSLAVTPTAPRPGQSITVSYADAPDSTTWIGLYLPGSSNTSQLVSVTVPHSGAGTVTFAISSSFVVGQTYEARMLPSNGYTDIATSNSFTVASPNPTYALTVMDGVGGASNLHTGDVVTIAATPGSGQTFVHWSMYGAGNGTIVDALSATTNFIVGTSDATVQALYDQPLPVYTLTVNGGNALPAGPRTSGAQVTITASPPGGSIFTSWTLASGPGSILNPNQATTVFTFGSAAATVQANFASGPVPNPPTNVVASNVTTTGLTLSWTAPTGGATAAGYRVLQNGAPLPAVIPGTSTALTGLTSGTAYQFQVQAKNAAGEWSSSSTAILVTTTSVAPVRLALQYWRANDYPGYPSYSSVWVDGYWDPDWYWDNSIYLSEGFNYCDEWYDPDGNDYGTMPSCFVLYGWDWVDGHYENQQTGTYADGQYGSSWSTNLGPFDIANSASGYTSANANRGILTNSYPVGQQISFRAWGQAPASNCNSYQAKLYSPAGSVVQQSGTFSSGSYWYCQFTPSTSGVYRVDISYLNATGGANPANATVSYFIPVGSLTAQTITFPAIANHLFTDPPFALAATASSGLPVSYSVQSGPATLSGNLVTLTGADGTVTIRATQNGSGTFNVAPYVDRSFTVSSTPTPVAIAAQPQGQTVYVGTSATFTVVASGIPLPTYQWRKDGTAIAGANSPALVLANVQSGDAGSYTVDVSNSLPSTATSVPALLTVNPAPPSGGSGSMLYNSSGTYSFTVPAGIHYLSICAIGRGGAGGGGYNRGGGGGGGLAYSTFAVTPGQVYTVTIDGSGTRVSSGATTIVSAGAGGTSSGYDGGGSGTGSYTASVNGAAVLNGGANQGGYGGGWADDGGSGYGGGGGGAAGYGNGGSSGAGAGGYGGDGGWAASYDGGSGGGVGNWGGGGGGGGSGDSDNGGNGYGGAGGGTGIFGRGASGNGGDASDGAWATHGFGGSGGGNGSGDSEGPHDGGSYGGGGNSAGYGGPGACRIVWPATKAAYATRCYPINAGVLLPANPVTLTPGAANVAPGATQTFSVSGGSTGNYLWSCTAGTISGSGATITWTAPASGATATIDVYDAGGTTHEASPLAVAAITMGTLPVITTQPASQSVAVGGTATFTVVASGAPPLAYQWKKDGVTIGGATAASLTINNVQATNAGSYTVAVTNSGGSVTSNAATLTVGATSNDPTNQNQLNIHIPLLP